MFVCFVIICIKTKEIFSVASSPGGIGAGVGWPAMGVGWFGSRGVGAGVT